MNRTHQIVLMIGQHGEPVQATVVVFEDGEKIRATTTAIEPFVSWVEVVNGLLDSLPVQLRML